MGQLVDLCEEEGLDGIDFDWEGGEEELQKSEGCMRTPCAETTTPTSAAATPDDPRHLTRTHDVYGAYPPGSPRGCLYDIPVTKP